jgi:DNA-binding phage protein
VPHAEAMTLTELASQPALGGDAELLKAKLLKTGVSVVSVDETLAEIAARNHTTAEKLYQQIAPSRNGTATLPREGLGRKTLQEIAADAGVSATSLRFALRQQQVDADPSSTLREIADSNHISMEELRGMLEQMLSP